MEANTIAAPDAKLHEALGKVVRAFDQLVVADDFIATHQRSRAAFRRVGVE
jgi:hypothetical protein